MRLKNRFWSKLLCVAVIPIMLLSCKKENDNEPVTVNENTKLKLQYAFNGSSLSYDSILYVNQAGNSMSVEHLEYYLSGFRFKKNTGEIILVDKIFYVDARKSEFQTLDLGTIPEGNYTEITFYIGLDSANNISNSLPPTTYNINMAWPDMMGGGYHFMKLEGHFTDGSTYGYAVHLGRNFALVTCSVVGNFTLSAAQKNISMEMDIAEWFKTPYTYNFSIDPNYTMGDSTSMSTISQNGSDVFTLKNN